MSLRIRIAAGSILWTALSTLAFAETKLPKIGEIWFHDANAAKPFRQPFFDGLRSLGYVDGKNVILITRYASGDAARLPAIVKALVSQNVDVLFITQKVIPAALAQTKTIPIVCPTMFDPVQEGHVASLARPGGNLTGLSWQTVDTTAKRLELTKELLPDLKRVGVLFDAGFSGGVLEVKTLREAASTVGIAVSAFEVRSPNDFDSAFAKIERDRLQALIVVDSALPAGERERIGQFTQRIRLPMVSESRYFADVGAVLTYGASLDDMMKRAASYVDKILKGAKPSDLPIEQPTKWELIVNGRIAKALGIKIPEAILLRTDEVIR